MGLKCHVLLSKRNSFYKGKEEEEMGRREGQKEEGNEGRRVERRGRREGRRREG